MTKSKDRSSLNESKDKKHKDKDDHSAATTTKTKKHKDNDDNSTSVATKEKKHKDKDDQSAATTTKTKKHKDNDDNSTSVAAKEKKHKDKDDQSATTTTKTKKHKDNDDNSTSVAAKGKKHKDNKDESSISLQTGGKKKKHKDDTSEGSDKKKKKKKQKGKKEKKKKKSDAIDKKIKANLNEEEKQEYVETLKTQIRDVKKQLKSCKYSDYNDRTPIAILKMEIANLEVDVINLKTQYHHLTDRQYKITSQYENCCKLLQNSRTEALDVHEFEFLHRKVDIKRDELLTTRSIIREMKDVGWTMLPVKVADDCKKTQMELDNLHQIVKGLKEEFDALRIIVEETRNEVDVRSRKYNKILKKNKEEMAEIEVVHVDMLELRIVYETKLKESTELTATLESIKQVVEEAKKHELEIQEQGEIEVKKFEEHKEQMQKMKKERDKEIHKHKKEHKKMVKESKKDLIELKQLKKELRRLNRHSQVQIKNIPKEKMEDEYSELKVELDVIRNDLLKEIKLKLEYLDIIEDMQGKMKILAMIMGKEEDDGIIHLDRSGNAVLLEEQKIQFDYVFDSKKTGADIFNFLESMYERANEGFSNYVVLMGGADADKGKLVFGKNDEGFFYHGLHKLQNIMKKNKKSQSLTRYILCAFEMTDTRVYDLLKNSSNDTLVPKMDYFKMTVMKHGDYKECTDTDCIKKHFDSAIKNRPAAQKSLNAKDGESSFIGTIAIEVRNKLKHKFYKGKVSIVILGDYKKMPQFNKSLKSFLESNKFKTTDSHLCAILADAFGGSSKTCILGCVSPLSKNNEETKDIINLVSSLKKAQNIISKNIDAEEMYRMKNSIERLTRGVKEEVIL